MKYKSMVEGKDLDKAFYEIRVKGSLDARWYELFEGMTIASENNVTTISGMVPDQAALHGLLARVRDYGFVLISINRAMERTSLYRTNLIMLFGASLWLNLFRHSIIWW